LVNFFETVYLTLKPGAYYLVDVHSICSHSLGLTIYDSLIIASATEADCEILYAEDLQHNHLVENKLRIVNPFI